MNKIFALGKDQSGATASEYGLIPGLISIVMLGALKLIGTNLNSKFTNIAGALN